MAADHPSPVAMAPSGSSPPLPLPTPGDPETPFSDAAPSDRSKKKGGNSVCTRPASPKGKRKAKQTGHGAAGANGGLPRPSADEDKFLLSRAPYLGTDLTDDAPKLPVLLSRVYRSDRIEMSEDRLSASSSKGFRMIRATRGVASGAWYYEIKVMHIGPSSHTRLGWATNMADLHAPVGFDMFGFAYRNVDGAKVTKGRSADYAAEGYGEGDTLGFYISLPEGEHYEPTDPDPFSFKGVSFHSPSLADEFKNPYPVPGSEICYFKNGVWQGTAYVNIPGGRYYPAASMYTLPDEPKCEVRFNFGPVFEFFPKDFEGLPAPLPMSEVPYQIFYHMIIEEPAQNGPDYDEASDGSDSDISMDYEVIKAVAHEEVVRRYSRFTPSQRRLIGLISLKKSGYRRSMKSKRS